MSDDIVTALREEALRPAMRDVCTDAADEIERLRAVIAEWVIAKTGEHWINTNYTEWHTACGRLYAAEDALLKEARRG